MKRFLLASCAVLSLAGCGLPQLSLAQPPAPLAATVIDDQAIITMLNLFEFALGIVDARIDAGKLVPGSPEARALSAKIRQIDHLLAVAEAAQKTGQSTTYNDALRQANVAIGEFKAALN